MIRPRGPPSSVSPEEEALQQDAPANPSPPDYSSPEHPREEQDQDFIYTRSEFSAMAEAMEQFASSGLLSAALGDGFVFGVLRYDNSSADTRGRLTLDVERCKTLVGLAGGLRCVLHRALDGLLAGPGCGSPGGSDVDVEGVMASVRDCGFDGVLTCGGKGPRAVDNIPGLTRVVAAAAAGGEMEVVVGGGVRRENLLRLVEGFGQGEEGQGALGDGVWFHSSCLGAEERFDEGEASSLAEEMRALGLTLP